MARSKWGYCLTSALAFGAQACGAEGGTEQPAPPEAPVKVHIDEQAARELNLVDRLVVNPELVVEFYEPAPGVLLTSQYGIAGQPTLQQYVEGVKLADLRPSDYYALFAPGREMPPALAAAEARQNPRADTASILDAHVKKEVFSAGSLSRPQDATVDKGHGGSCDAGWYEDTHCHTEDWDFDYCFLNQTAGGSSWCNDTAWYNGSLCTDRGNVTWNIRLSNGASGGGSWSVLQGHVRSYNVTCGSEFINFCVGFDIDISITNVGSSDRFHDAGGCLFD